MSNYTKSTNFATKDALPSGDPLKIVKGTEIDTEFNNIASAVATKADSSSPTFNCTSTTPVTIANDVGMEIDIGMNGNDFAFSHTQAGDFITYDYATGDLYFAGVSAGASTAAVAETVNDGAVTEAKIGTGAVTVNKIGTGAVTETKIGAGAVTEAKIGTAAVTVNKIGAGAVTTAKVLDANITAAKLDGAQTGTAPIYGARAWVNFNGTGTVAIRASGNVSSITDNGVGDYTVNFSTAMPDANYGYAISISGKADTSKTVGQGGASAQFSPTTSAVRVFSSLNGVGASDCDGVCVTIHR